MLNTARGQLVIIDGKEVYWKGAKVERVEGILVHSFDSSIMVKLDINNPADSIASEMRSAGIMVKVTK